MWLSSAMVQVASHGAHSEQVDEEMEGEEKGAGLVVESVEENADWNYCHCHHHQQDQHLTKETLVYQGA